MLHQRHPPPLLRLREMPIEPPFANEWESKRECCPFIVSLGGGKAVMRLRPLALDWPTNDHPPGNRANRYWRITIQQSPTKIFLPLSKPLTARISFAVSTLPRAAPTRSRTSTGGADSVLSQQATPMLNSAPAAAIDLLSASNPSDVERIVEFTLARTQADLLAAFRLLYLSYVRAGLAAENALQLRLTPFHPLHTTEVFVAKCRDEVVSTMTMVADGVLGLPMDSMYGAEVQELKRSGLRVAEMGCFADRRTSPARFKAVFGRLASLVVQVARVRNINALVAATHPKHARFYVRWLGFEYFGELKQCPYAAGNPAVALLLDFEAIRNTVYYERLFGNPVAVEQLIPTRWSPATIDLLRSLAAPPATATALVAP